MNISSKIYVTVAIWLALCGAMFFYGFKILDNENHQALGQISKEKNQLLVLQAQDESYRQSQKDLKDIAAEQYQPADFFSQDITLVKEIEAMETLGQTSQVTLNLGGISGTINTESKAKTQSSLFVVPYTLTVTGPFSNVVNFIESLENLDFITTLSSLNLGSGGDGNVNATIGANFYIRKQ